MSRESATLQSAQSIAPRVPRRRLLVMLESRFVPPIFITCILVASHLSFGILESYEWTGLAIVTAIAAELAMGRITYGSWPHPASAYITGISVGILVRSPFLWPYFLTSLISIASKYVLRCWRRHTPQGSGIRRISVSARCCFWRPRPCRC